MSIYEQLILRNGSYISNTTQHLIRQSRILIAGCGVGSNIAETAARTGFENFTLVDADCVEAHNLNRQVFGACDVGSPKVFALARHVRSINPSANIQQHNCWLTSANVRELVSSADLIFDAIDLTSMEDIVALHDECQRQSKPIIAVFSIGWGCGALYFPANGVSLRGMLGLPSIGPVSNAIHGRRFAQTILGAVGKMDRETQAMMLKAIDHTEEGIPCPGHVSVGYSSVGALAITIAVRVFNNEPIASAPHMLISNLSLACTVGSLELASS